MLVSHMLLPLTAQTVILPEELPLGFPMRISPGRSIPGGYNLPAFHVKLVRYADHHHVLLKYPTVTSLARDLRVSVTLINLYHLPS